MRKIISIIFLALCMVALFINTSRSAELKVNPLRTVYFYGLIEYGVSGSVVTTLNTLNLQSLEPIYLVINSPGGQVEPALSVINAIQDSTAPGS